MRIAAMFFWLVLPVAAYLGYVAYGLPHVIVSYSFHDNGDPFNPLAQRHYTDCTFWGPYGAFTVAADAGRCGWIEFFQSPSAQ